MNNIELKLENVKLHNKIQKIRITEEKRAENIKKNKNSIISYVEEEINKLKAENEKIRKEKEELEKSYYAIPKWIRFIFKREEKSNG